MSDDWIDEVRPDGSRVMVRAEETLNGIKQRIILILYDELYVSGDHSIEGRMEAADRIIAEIIAPLRDEAVKRAEFERGWAGGFKLGHRLGSEGKPANYPANLPE